jgi:hypothetical protein
MISLDLVDEFITFLREKGNNKDADEMAATYEKFKETVERSKKEIEERLSSLAHGNEETAGQVTDDLVTKVENDIITLEDCDFVTCAILPNGNMHIVDIDPDDIKDLIVDIGHFRVHENPIGKAELNPAYFGNKPNDKYLN